MLEKIGNQKRQFFLKKKQGSGSKNDTHLTFEIIQLN